MPTSIRVFSCQLLLVVLTSACASEEGPADTNLDAGPNDAASDAANDASDANDAAPVEDPACGARWPDASDACWACLCGTCPAETKECGPACGAVTQCAYDNGCLGDHGVIEETLCLVSRCQQELQAAPTVGTWDQCLLRDATFPRRSCDEECGFYPWPEATE